MEVKTPYKKSISANSKAYEPNEAEQAIISRLVTDETVRGELYFSEIKMAHNYLDSDGDQFTVPYLRAMAQYINGEVSKNLNFPLILHHELYRGIPIGAVFAAIYSMFGLDMETALSASITALANVGPGVGKIIGPAGNFHTLPDAVKWLLSFEMILGRLEIIAGLVILNPDFWLDA